MEIMLQDEEPEVTVLCETGFCDTSVEGTSQRKAGFEGETGASWAGATSSTGPEDTVSPDSLNAGAGFDRKTVR